MKMVADLYDNGEMTHDDFYKMVEEIKNDAALDIVRGTLKSQRFNNAEELTEWVNKNNIDVVSITDHEGVHTNQTTYKKIVMYYR